MYALRIAHTPIGNGVVMLDFSINNPIVLLLLHVMNKLGFIQNAFFLG